MVHSCASFTKSFDFSRRGDVVLGGEGMDHFEGGRGLDDMGLMLTKNSPYFRSPEVG